MTGEQVALINAILQLHNASLYAAARRDIISVNAIEKNIELNVIALGKTYPNKG